MIAGPVTRASSVLDLIGNTPLVRLNKMSPKESVSIWVKLEGQNPTGSVKDRIARAMIDAARADGSLAPGQTILEPTSGSVRPRAYDRATRRYDRPDSASHRTE